MINNPYFIQKKRKKKSEKYYRYNYKIGNIRKAVVYVCSKLFKIYVDLLMLCIIFLHKSEPSVPCNTTISPQDGVTRRRFVLHSFSSMYLQSFSSVFQFSQLRCLVTRVYNITLKKKMWSSNTQNNIRHFKRFLKLGLKNQLRAGVRWNHRRIKYDSLIHNRLSKQ